uniref:Uncharacterized protein n=1 Tax=Opuntia streptacantha TaxID=393608 RepID=A0A7C9ETH4_OPUST
MSMPEIPVSVRAHRWHAKRRHRRHAHASHGWWWNKAATHWTSTHSRHWWCRQSKREQLCIHILLRNLLLFLCFLFLDLPLSFKFVLDKLIDLARVLSNKL